MAYYTTCEPELTATNDAPAKPPLSEVIDILNEESPAVVNGIKRIYEILFGENIEDLVDPKCSDCVRDDLMQTANNLRKAHELIQSILDNVGATK